MKKWTLLALLLLFTLTATAQENLPQSDWYAVAWNEESDTLHWINADGEQVSIERPRLPDENGSAGETTLFISPDGATMVITAPLNTGQYGIGFYDFASGEMLNFHQTQSDEVTLNSPAQHFSTDSQFFALILHTQERNAWRILVFDRTGNVPYVLSHDPRTIPQAFVTELSSYPQIMLVTHDSETDSVDVRFQMIIPNFPQVSSYGWRSTSDYPAGSLRADWLTFPANSGYDTHPQTGDVLLARINPANGIPTIPDAGNTISIQSSADNPAVDIFSTGEFFLSHPRFLNNGDWIGYQQYSPDGETQFSVMTVDGEPILTLEPDIINIAHTPDGLLAITENTISHITATGETVIFEMESSVNIIYSTPPQIDFSLETISD